MLRKRYLIGIPLTVAAMGILFLTITSINSQNPINGSSGVAETAANAPNQPSPGVGVPLGHPEITSGPSPLQPLFTTRIVPNQINMTRGSSADVTVYLYYKYVPGVNAPNQITVNMVPDKSYTLLNIWANVDPDTVDNWINAYHANGTAPPGLYNKTQLELYPNAGPIVINANETKSVTMRITIPANYPDDFLNKNMILHAASMYPDRIMGISGYVWVKVIG